MLITKKYFHRVMEKILQELGFKPFNFRSHDWNGHIEETHKGNGIFSKVGNLEKENKELKEELKETRRVIGAITEYLGVSMKKEWIDDPSLQTPEHPKKEIIKCYKSED